MTGGTAWLLPVAATRARLCPPPPTARPRSATPAWCARVAAALSACCVSGWVPRPRAPVPVRARAGPRRTSCLFAALAPGRRAFAAWCAPWCSPGLCVRARMCAPVCARERACAPQGLGGQRTRRGVAGGSLRFRAGHLIPNFFCRVPRPVEALAGNRAGSLCCVWLRVRVSPCGGSPPAGVLSAVGGACSGVLAPLCKIPANRNGSRGNGSYTISYLKRKETILSFSEHGAKGLEPVQHTPARMSYAPVSPAGRETPLHVRRLCANQCCSVLWP